jgi:c-di-GMP-binding flagellar brake protein YcgR
MSFGKYFNKGQKVFLKRHFEDHERKALDTITGYAMRSHPMQIDIGLPYGSDAADNYPFEPGMKFEIMTDNKGMGLRLSASFVEKISGQDIRLQFDGNLEFISRRIYPRVDVNAWVGIKRDLGNLAEMRATWDEHVKKIKAGVSAAELTEFNKYLVNLAGGGMRLPVDGPIEIADLLMIYLSIGDKKGIICSLAEVVWVGPDCEDGKVQTGLRFLNILEEDQTRIDAVVKILLERLGKTGQEGDD